MGGFGAHQQAPAADLESDQTAIEKKSEWMLVIHVTAAIVRLVSRTYGQLCPLARALDHVGDRWTLLVVRDLAAGPRRYSDLLAGLPGIGTTLLAERLRRLTDDGLVERRDLPPPAASTVYELTPAGSELLHAVVPLASWGLRFLGDIDEADVRPEWVLMFMQTNFDRDAARGVHDVYELYAGSQRFHVVVSDGAMTAAMGPPPRPADAVIRTSWTVLAQLGLGEDPDELARSGALALEGDPKALARCYGLLVGDRRSPALPRRR